MGEPAGGECSEGLQMFSAYDLHRCFHPVAKMHWAPETRASWCESDGTWTLWQVVFQCKPMECTRAESHVRPISSKMERPPKAEAEIGEGSPHSASLKPISSCQMIPSLALPSLFLLFFFLSPSFVLLQGLLRWPAGLQLA